MTESEDSEALRERYIGVGCFTAFAGLISGPMVFVLIAKAVGTARRCVPPEGLPACDWHYYAGVGAVVGAVTLPILVLRAMKRSRRMNLKSDGS